MIQPHFPEVEKILLKSGREIIMDQIYIYYTYLGILMGDPVECSTDIRNRLRSSILDIFPSFEPLYILDGGWTVLLAYTFVADVHLHVPINPKNDLSFLHICWFTNDISRPLPSTVKDILDRFVWEDWAKDGCF